MLSIPWNNVTGWGQAKIEPRRDITVDPLAGVMQYAGTCFEGMKVSLGSMGLTGFGFWKSRDVKGRSIEESIQCGLIEDVELDREIDLGTAERRIARIERVG